MFGLYSAGAAAAKNAGYQVMYSLPAYGWLSWFRWLPRAGAHHHAERTCSCFELPVGNRPLVAGSAGLAARLVKQFTPDFEDLWQSCVDSFPITCGVVRSQSWLNYKNGGHLNVEVRQGDGGPLVGYAAIRRSDGLLMDYLARTSDDLARVLAAAIDILAAEGSPRSIKVMDTPALRPALEVLGASCVDFRFAFVCHTLDPALPRENELIESWYLTPGE
jgi:hypothetical protein